jgi:hypothetical protein
MLVYAATFIVSLGGYAGLPIWVIGVGTIALASLSYAEHYRLYRRGAELGMFEQIDSTMIGSLLNALGASTMAYGAGVIVRFVAGM